MINNEETVATMHLSEKRPLIVDIRQNSLDDGPGIRTVLFFKGCPLRCVWCQNPETQNPNYELIFQPENCLKCDACRVSCPDPQKTAFYYNKDSKNSKNMVKKIKKKTNKGTNKKDPQLLLDREKCTLCFNCVSSCPAEVFQIAGKYYEPSEVANMLYKNYVFYKNTGGGVTFSGGEPLLFPSYLEKLTDEILKKGQNETNSRIERPISICIETAGAYKLNEARLFVLEHADLIFFDLKIIDPTAHKKYCGIENSQILDNFKKLISNPNIKLAESIEDLNFKAHYPDKTILVPRTPLIPDITLKEEHLIDLKKFLRESGVKVIDFLPYNPLWIDKLKSLGKSAKYDRSSWMKDEEYSILYKIFQKDDFEYLTFKYSETMKK
ncbi:MAG: 4Fe-4S cluster-binding domain-containing protein [Promethearchaeota archaeon]